MAVGANLVRALTGGRANAVEIHFCRRPPPDPGLYERILKTKALFDQYQSCVIISRSDLKLSTRIRTRPDTPACPPNWTQ